MHSHDSLTWLAPDAGPAERGVLRRLATLLRLVCVGTERSAPSRAEVESELEVLFDRETLGCIAGLTDLYLDAALKEDPRTRRPVQADRCAEEPARGSGVDHQVAWSHLDAARRRGRRVPGVPAPGESGAAICGRLIEGAERYGAGQAWLLARRALKRRLPHASHGGPCLRGQEPRRLPGGDPRAVEAGAILEGIGGSLRGRRLLLFDTEEGMVLAGARGERIWEPIFWAGIHRAACEGEVTGLEPPGAKSESEDSTRRARKGWALPLRLFGRVHGLVVLLSSRRNEEEGLGERWLRSLATGDTAVRWRAAQFRAWHRRAHGFDPWFDPTGLALGDRIGGLLESARSGIPVKIEGSAEARNVLERWFRFERAGSWVSPNPGVERTHGLPPLSDRRDEIAGLAARWLRRLAPPGPVPSIPDATLGLLWRQDWGEHSHTLPLCLARALRVARPTATAQVDGDRTQALLEPAALRCALRLRGLVPVERLPSRNPRRLDLLAALCTTRHRNGNWNRSRAASILGWDQATLAARMAEAELGTGKKVGGASCVPR